MEERESDARRDGVPIAHGEIDRWNGHRGEYAFTMYGLSRNALLDSSISHAGVSCVLRVSHFSVGYIFSVFILRGVGGLTFVDFLKEELAFEHRLGVY